MRAPVFMELKVAGKIDIKQSHELINYILP